MYNPQFWTLILVWCRLQNLKVDLLVGSLQGSGIRTLVGPMIKKKPYMALLSMRLTVAQKSGDHHPLQGVPP